MKDGYFLLHRKVFGPEAWKHPERSLAWIEFCSMAAWQDYTADDGVLIRRGEVIASYGFLATRWGVSKDTAFNWIKHWIAERQVERRPERCTERLAERFFVLNYAKYQDGAEREGERLSERTTERVAEQIKVKEKTKSKKLNDVSQVTRNISEYIDQLCTELGMTSKVNIALLDELVARYKGPPLRGEVRKCMAWMVDHGKREITTLRLTNWLAKAGEIAKREDNRRLEWLQSQKDPALAASLKSRGEKKPDNLPTVETFSIDPALRSQLFPK